MKKLILPAIFAILATAAVAATNATNTAKRRLSVEERRALRLKRIAESGGYVTKEYKGKYIYIVNDQKRVDEKDFFAGNDKSIEGLFQLPVRIVPPKTDLSRAGLTIIVSDNDTAPSLLVAPEIPWAGINVRALASDSPKHEVLVSRLQKEIWRAFMYACGAANSVMQPCVMHHVVCNADLDRCATIVPCPESLPRMMNTARALRIEEPYTCTYKQACQEGWAPSPTNDVQKKIWNETYAAPDRPIKIEK